MRILSLYIYIIIMQECKLDFTHIIAIITYLGLFFTLEQILSAVFTLSQQILTHLQVNKLKV